jgi:hypothetical protein
MMQFIVPTMADGCRSKTELSQVFGISATLSFFSNLGILLALFFGQDQPDSANIWVNYHGGTGEADPAAWATAISIYCSVCGDPFHPSILSCGVKLAGYSWVLSTESCPRGGTRLENPHGILDASLFHLRSSSGLVGL